MRAVIHLNHRAPHHREMGAVMLEGLARHGIMAGLGHYNAPEPCDVAITWGARQPALFAPGRPPVLIMERGHVGDRYAWTSCGWDGLGRRGRYPAATDGGARWRQHHGHLIRPWAVRAGYALIIGQVPGDAALRDLDMLSWAGTVAAELRARGWEVRFRPHPLAPQQGPAGVTLTRGRGLAADLAGAALCVTYNSTSGVEAVLAGVPTVTLDPGAMAWPVATHTVAEAPETPDREAWAHDLAWTQWTLAEIRAGEMWDAVGPLALEGVAHGA